MRTKNRNGTPTLGVIDVVQIVFVILKLTKVISWSWGVVLIPLWIILAMLFVYVVLYITSTISDNHKS